MASAISMSVGIESAERSSRRAISSVVEPGVAKCEHHRVGGGELEEQSAVGLGHISDGTGPDAGSASVTRY